MDEQLIKDLLTKLDTLLTKYDNNQGNSSFSGSRSIGVNSNNNFLHVKDKELKEIISEIKKLNRKQELRSRLRKSGFDDIEEYKQRIKTVKDNLRASKEFKEEEKKFENEILEIDTQRKKTSKTNLEYQTEQQRHSTKLADIEASVRKSHITTIKKLYKREEKIRENGIAEMEQKQKQVNDYVKQTKSKVAIAEDHWYARKGQFSAGKELWNKLLLGPLQEKWFSVFGNGKRGLQSTQTIGTSLVKGGSAIINTGDKALKSIATGKMDASGMAGNISSKLMQTGNPYAMAAGGALSIFTTLFEMFSKVDKAASDYARSVGGGAYAQVKMRKTAADLAVEMGNLGERTYNTEKILANMAEISEVFGRNLEYLSTADLKAITDLKDFGIGNNTISDFDTLGISVERVSKEIASIYGSAGKHGLNAKAVTKAVADNLKLAQNYTFARGRKAIFDMAEKSAQLKFNLRDAEAFANKVGTLEGAMKTAAQLSVLGGNFAMQGNPMTLLYNALNDVEGLQDQMLAMTKNLVYWDNNKQQLDMSAFDRQRLRATAEASGIDYGDFMNQAFNQERVRRISRELPAGLDKDTAEYIKNIATLDEYGNAQIQFHNEKGDKEGKAKTLSEVLSDPELLGRLKGESEAKDVKEGATVGDILNNTRSIQDKLDDLINQVKNYLVKGVMRLVDRFSTKNQVESMYGFEGDKKEQFRRVRDKLSNGTLTTADFRGISKEDKELYKRMGILDEKGIYRGRSINERYGKSFLNLWGGDLYGNTEIGQMFNDAYEGVKPKTYGLGGYTGDGPKDKIAGLVHNREFVIPAEETESMIKNGKNPLDFKHFSESVNNNANKNIGGGKGSDKPIKVEFGTLRLELGGVTKDIDMNMYANMLLANQSFIQTLIQKITNMGNFGYEKDNAQFPIANKPYSNIV